MVEVSRRSHYPFDRVQRVGVRRTEPKEAW